MKPSNLSNEAGLQHPLTIPVTQTQLTCHTLLGYVNLHGTHELASMPLSALWEVSDSSKANETAQGSYLD